VIYESTLFCREFFCADEDRQVSKLEGSPDPLSILLKEQPCAGAAALAVAARL
jgi:hypothetical protein